MLVSTLMLVWLMLSASGDHSSDPHFCLACQKRGKVIESMARGKGGGVPGDRAGLAVLWSALGPVLWPSERNKGLKTQVLSNTQKRRRKQTGSHILFVLYRHTLMVLQAKEAEVVRVFSSFLWLLSFWIVSTRFLSYFQRKKHGAQKASSYISYTVQKWARVKWG
jgi:hypothetical protein